MSTDYIPQITDEQWNVINPRITGRPGDAGCHGKDNRLFVEAVLWKISNRKHWRALPPYFGKWFTTYTRYRRWRIKGVWALVFDAMKDDDTFRFVLREDGIHLREVKEGHVIEKSETIVSDGLCGLTANPPSQGKPVEA